MLVRNILFLFIVFTFHVQADDHASVESQVVNNINAYWDARNAKDWDTVVALSSSSGMLNTNSDGSFHKPLAIQTAEEWAAQTPGNPGVISVHNAEAYQISDTVVYARYYAEGVVPAADGSLKPYRTRVTGTWVLEGKSWVAKSMHFSSANYGGVHQTQQFDFED
jgi:hypothetical protein